MSYSVSGTMITLTRGDTFTALITITDSEGNQYVPVKGDRIRFAMKTDYEDGAPLLIKEIPIDTMILVIEPEDTKPQVKQRLNLVLHGCTWCLLFTSNLRYAFVHTTFYMTSADIFDLHIIHGRAIPPC